MKDQPATMVNEIWRRNRARVLVMRLEYGPLYVLGPLGQPKSIIDLLLIINRLKNNRVWFL